MDDRTVGCDLPSMSEDVKIAEMTRLRSRLKRAKAAGLIDYQAVSLALSGKRNKTYIQQFITKESPRVMQDFLVKEVEAYLDSAEKGTLPPQSPSAGGIDLVRIPDLAIFGGMGSGGELDVYTRAVALLGLVLFVVGLTFSSVAYEAGAAVAFAGLLLFGLFGMLYHRTAGRR